MDILRFSDKGAAFLLNSPFSKNIVFAKLPLLVQEAIIEKELKLFVIDTAKVSNASGMGRRINTVMQTCFFAISGILEKEEAIAKIKKSIDKTYGNKGKKIVEMNNLAVDSALGVCRAHAQLAAKSIFWPSFCRVFVK